MPRWTRSTRWCERSTPPARRPASARPTLQRPSTCARPEVVRRLFTQKSPNPTVSTLVRLAAALGYHVELVRGSGRGRSRREKRAQSRRAQRAGAVARTRQGRAAPCCSSCEASGKATASSAGAAVTAGGDRWWTRISRTYWQPDAEAFHDAPRLSRRQRLLSGPARRQPPLCCRRRRPRRVRKPQWSQRVRGEHAPGREQSAAQRGRCGRRGRRQRHARGFRGWGCGPTNTIQSCGSCGNTCTTGVANAQPACLDGSTCAFGCSAGFTMCGGECVELTTSANCGSCGNACMGNASLCATGDSGTLSCTSACPAATPTTRRRVRRPAN